MGMSPGVSSTKPLTVWTSNPAPWWRCLHCGHNKCEEHVFTGHMKGVPMVHCAKCEALHSPPDPNSKTALRWKIGEMAEALGNVRQRFMGYRANFGTDVAEEIALIDAALAIAMETGTAIDSEAGVVAKP